MEIKLSKELKELNTKASNTISFATDGSAGLDLRAMLKGSCYQLAPGEVKLIDTGIFLNIADDNLAAVILPRSGLGHKEGIILGNSVGLIDSDYQGEIKVSLWNRSKKTFEIKKFDRIAQMVFIPVVKPIFNIVDEFSIKTQRGSGGFGSTGHA